MLANSQRPLDAGAAAPLSASGTWGPLLLTDDADRLPAALTDYLLDLKPGYADDPTRAVYNHVWLIGDPSALSVELQAEVDELAEVAPVTSGTGASSLGPAPGTPESQPSTPRPELEPELMSESERPDRLTGREITVEDVRALAGPSTPHFALQIRNRIQRLIAPLPRRPTRRGSRASARSSG